MTAQSAAPTAQINARIDPELKKRGDAALSAAGISPTEAVRALWKLVSDNDSQSDAALAALFPDRFGPDESELDDARLKKTAAIKSGPDIVKDAYRSAGLPWPPEAAALSSGESIDAAYEECCGDKMGWSK